MRAEFLVKNPQSLISLIDYQKDSIVSKEILKNKSGTVSLFAFDAGQGLSEHTAPFDALIQIIEGEAEIFIEDQTYMVHAGELVILPAHKPHALQAKKNFKMILSMLRSHEE